MSALGDAPEAHPHCNRKNSWEHAGNKIGTVHSDENVLPGKFLPDIITKDGFRTPIGQSANSKRFTRVQALGERTIEVEVVVLVTDGVTDRTRGSAK